MTQQHTHCLGLYTNVMELQNNWIVLTTIYTWMLVKVAKDPTMILLDNLGPPSLDSLQMMFAILLVVSP